MPKQVSLARFQLGVARLGPPRIPKCLENGLFLVPKIGQKWVKKVFFLKMILSILGYLNE